MQNVCKKLKMPAKTSPLSEVQKELSKHCNPVSYTRVNAVENFKTLGEFWQEIVKFAEENGMNVEDVNDARFFTNDQRITFDGVTAVVAQFERSRESDKPFENGYIRTCGPERIWFHLNGARYHFYEKNSPWALTLSNIENFKAVHTCEYESLKNVLGEAVISLPFNQQKIMAGKHEDVSSLIAYPDMASTTYREYLMGQLLPLVKESLLTIQKFIFICKKIIREREIQEAGKDYVP